MLICNCTIVNNISCDCCKDIEDGECTCESFIDSYVLDNKLLLRRLAVFILFQVCKMKKIPKIELFNAKNSKFVFILFYCCFIYLEFKVIKKTKITIINPIHFIT